MQKTITFICLYVVPVKAARKLNKSTQASKIAFIFYWSFMMASAAGLFVMQDRHLYDAVMVNFSNNCRSNLN